MGIEKILVVDDEALSRDFLAEALENLGYDMSRAGNAEEGLQMLRDNPPDLVISDFKMPGMDGLAFLKEIQVHAPGTPVVLLTAHGTVEAAVEAMKSGAVDFLMKPISADALKLMLDRIGKEYRMRRENEYLRNEFRGDAEFIGESPAISEVLEEVQQAARSKATALITGESGTGKERIAHRIHFSGPRAKNPFIRVNCAALSQTLLESELFGHERGAFTGATQKREGRFELADGGTLLLDEIGEIPLGLQAKLLRVLEEEEFERVGGTRTLKVDVRVLATTNRDLGEEVRKGTFREDLYYRLKVLPIPLPALRQRQQDIPLLAQYFLRKYSAQNGTKVKEFSGEVMQTLEKYPWPGNVRELENTVQRLVVRDRGETVQLADLPTDLLASPSPTGGEAEDPEEVIRQAAGRTLADIEKEVILATLDATGGNKTEAARILGVTARTLSNKLKLWKDQAVPEGRIS